MSKKIVTSTKSNKINNMRTNNIYTYTKISTISKHESKKNPENIIIIRNKKRNINIYQMGNGTKGIQHNIHKNIKSLWGQ